MRAFGWVNEKARVWWPLLVVVAAAFIVGAMVSVLSFVAEDRRGLEKQRDQLTELVETQRRSEETREQRAEEALTLVRDALREVIADHDAQMNRLMARQLDQIAQLLARPDGTPRAPVTARPQEPAPRPAPSPPPSSPSSTTTTTTTTTPDQKNCLRLPFLPRCD